MARSYLLLLSALKVLLICVNFHGGVTAEEFNDPMSSLVSANGYPLEVHSTTTADGYVLGMHRIPFGLKSPAAPNKPVVFLMHAMFSTSHIYVFLGKDNSLAFLLADAGYDVWLGNSRGNVYSRRNMFVSSDSSAFWQFSWHERGTLDLPAMIDYVLQETGQEKLSYVSLSLGGTIFFVMIDALPDYNDKIKVAVHLAPNVFMTNPHSPLEELTSHWTRFGEWIAIFIGLNELRLTPALAELFDIDRCRKQQFLQNLCSQMMFVTGGFDSKRINKTNLDDLARSPTLGTSLKEFTHFGQLVASKRFAKYDYGFVENVSRYGSLLPPSYDLGKVTAPTVIFSSKDDITITQEETDILLKALPNLVKHILIEEPGFTHVDFIAAHDAKTLVNDRILEEIKKY